MNITKKSERKDRFSTKKKIIVIIVISSVLLIIIGFYFYYSSIHVDNGRSEEGDTYAILSGNKAYMDPIFVEYNDLIYGFFSFISKNTFRDTDVGTVDQYTLSDIVYRTFDGENWSQEFLLSDPSDETSEIIEDSVIYNNKIYVVVYKEIREVIDNNQTERDDIYWNRSFLFKSFDENNWKDQEPLISQGKYKGGGIRNLIVWQDKIWAIWKSPVNWQYNEYYYKSYDGNNWSVLGNFTMPTPKTNNCEYLVFNNELWVTWQSDSEDIYLGKFNGTSVEIIANMTMDENNEKSNVPHITSYEGKIYVSWNGKEGILCRPFSEGELGITMHVDNGISVFLIVNNQKLYLIYVNRSSLSDFYSEYYIKSYDRNKWNDSILLTSSSYPGSEVPKAFTFNEKLYVYWESKEGEERKVAIREIE